MIRLLFLLFFIPFLSLAQGPFPPAVGEEGSDAISKNSHFIIGWGTSAEASLGYQDIADTSLGLVIVGTEESVIGPVDGDVLSLGDGGSATIYFDTPISDTRGADFAVFENSFSDSFLELAFVEVSSNGVDFFRFDAVSLTDTTVQVGTFGDIDPTNLNNLAGKYRGQYGTPFDLSELDSTDGLNIDSIVAIRVIDVVGSIDSEYATRDSRGNIINDPWPTAFESSGFDLDGIAVLTDVTSLEDPKKESLSFFPNPTIDKLYLEVEDEVENIVLYNSAGLQVTNEFLDSGIIEVGGLDAGIYFLHFTDQGVHKVKSFAKL